MQRTMQAVRVLHRFGQAERKLTDTEKQAIIRS